MNTVVNTLNLSTSGSASAFLSNAAAATITNTVFTNSLAGTFNLISNNTINVIQPVTASAITLNNTATDGTISVGGASGGLTTTGNGPIRLTGDRIILARNISAGTGTITMETTTNKTIQVAGATDNTDSATIMDISAPELARITAGQLIIGNTTANGTLTLAGNINVSGAGPGGVFGLQFNTGGNYVASSRTVTLGTRSFGVNALGTVATGSVTGGATQISISSGSTMTVNGNILATGSGTVAINSSGSGITLALANTIGGGTSTQISANGSITQTSGTLTGTSLTLRTSNGDIGTSTTRILNSASAVSLSTMAVAPF